MISATSKMPETYIERPDRPLNKPLPSSDEAERLILGFILLDNREIENAVDTLTPEDFYSPLHRRVYAAMLELHRQSKPIDPILIGEELKKSGSLDGIGGVATITNLTYGLPSGGSITPHAEIVAEKSRLRELIRTCSAIQSQALAEEDAATEVFTRAQALINKFAEDGIASHSRGFMRLDQILSRDVAPALDALERGEAPKIRSGFPLIDNAIGGGITTSDIVLLAGLPSSGKSALALQWAYNIASKNTPVAFFAGEMSNRENVFRLLSQVSGMQNLNSLSKISAEERQFLEGWAKAIGHIPLYLDYQTHDMQSLAVRTRSLARKEGVRVLVVDYIQLLKMEKIDKRKRFERISEVSQELKRLATELDIAIICVGQFNREGAKSGKPSMHDLDGSGQLEKDASMIFIIDRDEDSERVTIRIVKGRNTGNATIEGKFYGRRLLFVLD